MSNGTPFVTASVYANPEMDRVPDAASTKIDRARRGALFHDFQRIAMEDLPILPLLRPIYVTVASVKIKDFMIGPEGLRGMLAPTRLDA